MVVRYCGGMIGTDEYVRLDATAMAELVHRGDVSADELVEACERRIADLNPHLNAIANLVDAPPTREPAGGEPDGATFAGVPFLIKELLPTPGIPWSMGSRLFQHAEAPAIPPYVERLRGSGMRVLGSTTSSELGLLGSTETALHGVTHNPWGASLSAGGSSGGACAAVAAGIVPMAHGSDGGGSIRWPASIHGLFGFMPSAGRCVPAGLGGGGLADLVVDHCVTRSVRDSARMLAVTESDDVVGGAASAGQVTGPSAQRLRIGYYTETLTGRNPDAAIREALERTCGTLESLGHEVSPVQAPAVDGTGLSQAFFTSAAMTVASVAQMTQPLLGRLPGPDELEPFTLELLDWSQSFGPQAGADAALTLAEAGATYRTVFDHCDVVLTPTLPTLPWQIGTLAPGCGRRTLIQTTERLIGYTPIHNPAKCPAMSVPLEMVGKLPVGMHFAAAPGRDAVLLALAFELEAAVPWVERLPAFQQ